MTRRSREAIVTFTAGEVIDVHHTQFGVRTVERENGRLMLNGRIAFLPGVARHEEWPDTGRSASRERIVEDLSIIKELNALFLRMGHYPNHPYTYLVADRLGMAVMSEIPA
ncbi:MAG: glycoside hydrolase family 2 TIM barrel-domain containing protein [Candidatus Lernaella stagnicola]|nr:glycoside hydrolase family 2 TIM barrel-domain containing protein [Candidatus Lernaella stagnicola]